MVTASRVPKLALVLVCVLCAQSSSPLFASEPEQTLGTSVTRAVGAERTSTPSAATPALTQQTLHLTFDPARLPTLMPAAPNALEGGGQYYRGRRGRGRHDGAMAALVIGAAATITGAAVLTYANRPECSENRFAEGCGYGTKVIGTAVLAGGLVGVFAGAVAW